MFVHVDVCEDSEDFVVTQNSTLCMWHAIHSYAQHRVQPRAKKNAHGVAARQWPLLPSADKQACIASTWAESTARLALDNLPRMRATAAALASGLVHCDDGRLLINAEGNGDPPS
jgi:hypothetical protein